MSENSLFAILTRSSWLISLAIAVALGMVAHFLVPAQYSVAAFSVTIPFLITGAIAAKKQWQVPSSSRVESTLETVTAMPWREFSALVEQAYQRDGFVVTRSSGAADFTLLKAGRTSLLSCKRWKAANHGLEPLRELKAARRAQEAQEAIYVFVGAMTDNAQQFATDNKITLMQATELAQLLRLPKRPAKSAS